MSGEALDRRLPLGKVQQDGLLRVGRAGLLPVLTAGLASWSAFDWLVYRYGIADTPPLFPVVLVGVLVFWWQARRTFGLQTPSSTVYGCGCMLLLLYALSYGRVPGLLSTALAVITLGLLLWSTLPRALRTGSTALVPLLFAALPLGPSLNFFAGYPLRQLIAHLAAWCLPGGVEVSGTGLTHAGHTVFIDAPCSGVKMLGVAMLAGAALSLLLQLSPGRTLLLLLLAPILATLGNLARALVLFLIEARAVPEVPHTLVGLLVFAVCLLLLTAAAFRLQPRTAERLAPPKALTPHPSRKTGWARAAYYLAALLATLVPLASSTAAATPRHAAAAPPWPATWQGHGLRPATDTASIPPALLSFRGSTAEFVLDGTSTRILLRHSLEVSRGLHSAEECYRATGWTLSPLPPLRDGHGVLWGRFQASHPARGEWTVRQAYFALPATPWPKDLQDLLKGRQHWPDISSWYWAAARPGSGIRETLALTVAETRNGSGETF